MQSKYQIYICSTYGDLIEERKVVYEVILSLNQFPIGYEYFNASNSTPFEVAKKTIDKSDCMIVLLGEKYGSIDTEGVSYVEAEYNYALSKKLSILVFVKDIPYENASPELQRFRSRVLSNKLVVVWKDIDELKFKVSNSLYKTLINTQNDNISHSNHSSHFNSIIEEKEREYNEKIDSFQEELKSTLGMYTSIENNDIIGLMINNLNEIRQFYKLTKEQAINAYKLAKNSSIAGICLIIIAILVAVIYNNNQIALATTAGGIIIEVLAGTSLFVYEKTLKQLNYYYASLHNNERFLSLINIVSKTNTKDELYSKIVESELDNLKQYEIKNDKTQ